MHHHYTNGFDLAPKPAADKLAGDVTAALGAAVPLMLTAVSRQIPGVNGIPKAMRNAIETARAKPLLLVRAAVDKVVGKAEKWLGAMGGKGGTEGWVGVRDFAPPPGGTAYRLAVKVDGGSGQVTVLRSVVGVANSEQKFDPKADIQGVTGDARWDIEALLGGSTWTPGWRWRRAWRRGVRPLCWRGRRTRRSR